MTTLINQQSGGFGMRKLSTIARVKASDKERAAFKSTYEGLLPKGHPASPYQADWEDYTIMGAVSPIAFLQREMGNPKAAQEQAFDAGVRVRKGQSDGYKREGGTKALDLTAYQAWLKADEKTRLEMLKSAGLIA